MLKANVTSHEVIVNGEQQGDQTREQSQQNVSAAYKGKGGSSLATIFKHMSHALYLWMD